MTLLDKQTILPYLREHLPSFDQSGTVRVHAIGGPGEQPTCDDGSDKREEGGLINHIFRVSNASQSVIVKQAQTRSRSNAGIVLPVERNRREYESMLLRSAIVPQYVPTPYLEDPESAVLVMEDVSYLEQVHGLLVDGKALPRLAEQVGEYVAKNSFYYSEFYMDTDEFRRLACHFRNSDMRSVMESWVFLRSAPYLEHHGDLRLKALIDADPAITTRCYEMRFKFMTRAEALIHGDLHVSNMFADADRLKVIDMEYTFAGPMCYDIGYFSASLLTQYFTACFRPFPSEADRRAFMEYILGTVEGTYESFVSHFVSYWKRDAKPVYRDADGLLRRLAEGFLADVLAFMAIPCFSKVTTNPSEEFVLLDETDRERAMELALVVARQLLLHGNQFATMGDAMDGIREMTSIYLQNL